MPSNTLREALEDARGIVAAFGREPINEMDCNSAVREAVTNLETALDAVLDLPRGADIAAAHRGEVDRRARELLALWNRCGEKSRALILDVKTVLGRYLSVD